MEEKQKKDLVEEYLKTTERKGFQTHKSEKDNN